MKAVLKHLALIIALTLITIPSFGWARRVHSAIAYIAEQHLTPKAKKTVNEILDGKSMVYYGSWLDDYRKQMTIEYTNDDGEVKPRTIPHSFKVDNDHTVIQQENREAIDIICKSIKILEDYKNVDDSTRRAAMQCLIHLVGDIHCPAHVKYGDFDKNSTNKRYDATNVFLNKKKTRMHSIWDSVLIDRTTAGGVYDLAYLADRATKKEIKEIQKGTPYDWGKDVVYRTACVWTVCEGDKLPYSYMLQHRELAIDQIQRAGLRLAKVMNDIFK